MRVAPNGFQVHLLNRSDTAAMKTRLLDSVLNLGASDKYILFNISLQIEDELTQV